MILDTKHESNYLLLHRKSLKYYIILSLCSFIFQRIIYHGTNPDDIPLLKGVRVTKVGPPPSS